jgi:prepilin-type N-terminal cleavage/methylation domain-containing protein
MSRSRYLFQRAVPLLTKRFAAYELRRLLAHLRREASVKNRRNLHTHIFVDGLMFVEHHHDCRLATSLPSLDRSQVLMSRQRGFTMMELLVSIAVLSVLIALLVPAVQSAREAARRAQCLSNLKQIGIALHSYTTIHSGFPLGRLWKPALLRDLGQAPAQQLALAVLWQNDQSRVNDLERLSKPQFYEEWRASCVPV